MFIQNMGVANEFITDTASSLILLGNTSRLKRRGLGDVPGMDVVHKQGALTAIVSCLEERSIQNKKS